MKKGNKYYNHPSVLRERKKNNSSLKEIFKEENKKMQENLNWENYCGACDNLMTDDCPFKYKVQDDTSWKDLGCTNFID
jgi:hypothetical protein